MSSDQKQVLAVDIGGTKMAFATLKGDNLLIHDRVSTPQNPEEAVGLIVQTARKCGSIAAIGIGAPGPLDAERGVILTPPNLPGWHGYSLAADIEAELGLPVRLENDASLGALGEAVYGSGRGMKSIFYLTISTGIGSGLIVDGTIHSGRNGMAGELWAFQPGNFNGGADGPTIMDLASGPGLLRRARQRLASGRESILNEENLDMKGFLGAALDGDVVALEILEEGRDAIAAMLVAVIEIAAPDAVVLGGGLCNDMCWYVEPVCSRIRSWVKIPLLAQTPVHRARLWDEAVLYGAGVLVGKSS